jgi:hypothetical protein
MGLCGLLLASLPDPIAGADLDDYYPGEKVSHPCTY